MENEHQEDRRDLIHAVNAPLGFFALSLLIVEGFLTITLIFSNLSHSNKFIGMLIGAGLFFLVVLGVWFLVFLKPENLTFGEYSHLKKMEMQWGNSDKSIEKSEVEKSVNLSSPTTPQ